MSPAKKKTPSQNSSGSTPTGDVDQSLADSARLKLIKAASQVKKTLVGRDEVVDCVMASLISGVPLVLFGPPGTAKSACVRLIANQCTTPTGDGGSFFEYLMTKHTMPEELFGAADIEKLLGTTPEFVRNTKGMLPSADFVFLDEVFRGGGHILNTLLSVINEGRFHNGKKVIDVPLIGVIGAANEPPLGGDDLGAFYDRFPLRLWLPSILEADDEGEAFERAEKLLKVSLKSDYDSLQIKSSGSRSGSEPECSPDDFRIGRKFIAQTMSQMPASDRFAEYRFAFMHLRNSCGLSDRSFATVWRFGCALDWLRHGEFTEGYQGDNKIAGHFDALELVGRDFNESQSIRVSIDALKVDDIAKSKH